MNSPGNAIVVDKNWAESEAWMMHHRAIKADPKLENSMAAPFFQWYALNALDYLQQEYEAGDTLSLLSAVNQCAMHDLPMPEWVRRGYIDRYRRVVEYEVKSWDDAFGRPHPKGLHLENARHRRSRRCPVYVRVHEILHLKPDTSIDRGLFERVGAEFGISKTVAEELYYEVKHWFERSRKNSQIPGNISP